MKVICIDAFYDATNGFLGLGAKPKRPIEGLTEGKQYTAQVVNILSYGGNVSVSNDIQFLVWNDNEVWETYPINCFKPA